MNPDQLLACFDRIADAPGAVEGLRRFILDLAVRGRLVEQDSSEEPVKFLLERVEREKKELERDRKIPKQKFLPSIKDSEIPFRIPESWKWIRLGKIAMIITKGSTPTSFGHSFVPSGVNFIKVQSIQNGKLLKKNVSSFISQETHDFMGRSKLEKGDFLFSIAGSIGTSAIVTPSILPANTNQALSIIRGAVSALNLNFLQNVVQSSLIELAKDRARGGAMNNISLGDVKNFLLPLPPLPEQHRIVAKVDELMALCDELEAAQTRRENRRNRLVAATLHGMNNGDNGGDFRENARFYFNHLPRLATRPEHIQQLRQTILNLAVRGRLVEQVLGEECFGRLKSLGSAEEGGMPFKIPNNWRWVEVGDVAETRLGKMLDKAKNKGYPRPYLRNVNVRWFGFDFTDLYQMRFQEKELEEFSLKRGDVLICEGGEPGRAAVWEHEDKEIFFQKAIHRVRFFDLVLPTFFLYCIKNDAVFGRLNNFFTGVAIKHFTGKKLKRYSFPLPSLTEQHRIVAKVDELMTPCDQLESRLAQNQTAAQRLLESTLHVALNGSPPPAPKS